MPIKIVMRHYFISIRWEQLRNLTRIGVIYTANRKSFNHFEKYFDNKIHIHSVIHEFHLSEYNLEKFLLICIKIPL